jgi:NAD-dependent dihydropyrimidine dehydrogenase PreA subunit
MAVLSKGGTPVLGLDIGAAFIKAVEMRPSKGALAITGVGVLPTPSGCIVNDEIVVNRYECYGCGLCVELCPQECIDMISRGSD